MLPYHPIHHSSSPCTGDTMATDGADGEPTSSSQPLFYGIAFTIIPSPTLTQHHATEVLKALQSLHNTGATYTH